MTRPTTRSQSTNDSSDLLDQPPAPSSPPLDDRILTVLDRIEQRLQTLESNQRLLTTQFENFTSEPTPIISTPLPQITHEDMETFLDTKFNETYRTTLDSFSRLSASVAEIRAAQPSITTPPSLAARSSGFFQKENKDFHVSKLVKLLADEKLGGDSLQDLELFFDGILSTFNSVALTNDLYPKYRDLPKSFDFQHHLCQLNRTILPSIQDQHQARANYKSFGAGLRRFLLHPSTIPKDTCPDSYLQLLSLRNEPDGFLILKNFTFLRSPQLDGKYRDFRSSINNLTIQHGEHIRTFYSCATWLSNEITLANLQDGTLTVLHERFLALLRDTKCHLIIGETSHYWREIKEHQRDPNNLTADLPWTLTSVLRSLEIVGVSILSSSPSDNNTSHLIPSYAASSYSDPSLEYINDFLPPYAAAGTSNPIHKNNHYTSSYTSNNKLTTNNKLPPTISTKLPPSHLHHSQQRQQQQQKEKHLLCKLCNNLHSSPWHTTEMCPLKDPTYIDNKTIRENVMQHNNLFGKINKNYNKNIDLPTPHPKPSKAIIPSQAHSATIITPDQSQDSVINNFDPYAPPVTPLEDPFCNYQVSPLLPDQPSTDDIIQTSSFEVPIPPSANLCTTHNSNPCPDSSTFVDLIFNPTDYLHFSS
jgi:hypothetical protein